MMVLAMATTYTNMGISVIPIEPHSKRPHFSKLVETGYCREVEGKVKAAWEMAQERIAPLDILNRWFGTDDTGVALVGGAVSGNMVYLDFDDIEGYRSWALDHKTIVNATAVQKSAHGYHVFFRTSDARNGNMYYRGQKVGQVKGEGGYVVCPPSWHPEGVQYRWLRQPENGVLSVKSLVELDISRQANPPSNGRRTRNHIYSNGKQTEWARCTLFRLAVWRASDYQEWLEVGLALSNLGSDGLALWHEWSAQSNKYEPEALDKKWPTFDPDGDLGLGSLGHWASQDDPERQGQNGWRVL